MDMDLSSHIEGDHFVGGPRKKANVSIMDEFGNSEQYFGHAHNVDQ